MSQFAKISKDGKVYDVSPLLLQHMKDSLATPLIDAAGTDVSHWFDPLTRNPKTRVSPLSNCTEVHCPQGRFLHVPPEKPEQGFSTEVTTPWWLDEKSYGIGRLAEKTITLKVCNTLSKQTVTMTVPVEETVAEIEERYF